MSLRKQVMMEGRTDLIEDSAQELESVEGDDEKEQVSISLLMPSSSRQRRRRERENRGREKEMTEEEMMDLALRLSEQEASDTALQRQHEEEALLKAIQESIVGKPFPQSQSQSRLRLCSRRKLLPSNKRRRMAPVSASLDLKTSEEVLEIDLTREEQSQNKKSNEGSSLPFASHDPQPIRAQCWDSSQSSDSTDLDEALPPQSPVLPPSSCREAAVHIPRLSQNLLETYRSSGFVLCSQGALNSPSKSPANQLRSCTFPRSPAKLLASPKSPLFSESEDETLLSQRHLKSPVFGWNTPQYVNSCPAPVCSQESFPSSARTFSCPAHGSVFPGSPTLFRNTSPTERLSIHGTPVFLETRRGAAEHGGGGAVDEEEMSEAEIKRSKRKCCVSSPHQDNSAELPPSDESEKLIGTSTDLDLVEAEPSSNMKLLWSDEDEMPAGPPSPVFPEEREATPPLNHVWFPAGSRSTEEDLEPISSKGPLSRTLSPPPERTDRPTVQYYWGVPFCPRGLDPDVYTQVILTQLDIYDQSLKQAQRRLLRKVPWGDAILPQPEKPPSPESPDESPRCLVPQRQGFSLRGKNSSDKARPTEEEAEEEEKDEEEEEGGGKAQMDTEECEVCPETQLSDTNNDEDDDKTQDVMMSPCLSQIHQSPVPPESPDLPQELTSPPDLQEEGEQMYLDVCGTRKTPDGCEETPQLRAKRDMKDDLDSGVDPDVDPVDPGVDPGVHPINPGVDPDVDPSVQKLMVNGLKRLASPVLDLDMVPPSPEASVDCPICQGSFPVTRIERHAAFCNGEVDKKRPEVEPAAPKPHRKRRRADVSDAAETNISCRNCSSSSMKLERCFICQKNICVTEFRCHTELCIARRPPPTRARTRGNLLSALDLTELRGAEAESPCSKLPSQCREVIDLRDEDDDDDGGGGDEEEDRAPSFRISNSPVRSFTSISEAAGCTVHLRGQQRARRPGNRRR